MKEIYYKIQPFTEQSIYISLGNGMSQKYLPVIHSLMSAFKNEKPTGFISAVPSYNNLTVYYDPSALYKKYQTVNVQEKFIEEIEVLMRQTELATTTKQKIIQIPVCYDAFFGHDLAFVADYNGFTVEDVIQIHSEAIYTVHMLGFSPGFPFLSGLSSQLETPRKTTPAQAIHAGSVGIAGKQTGIYPVETPGGWQIIGRTPISLFDLNQASPSLLNAGDCIQFQSISLQEFNRMEQLHHDYNT